MDKNRIEVDILILCGWQWSVFQIQIPKVIKEMITRTIFEIFSRQKKYIVNKRKYKLGNIFGKIQKTINIQRKPSKFLRRKIKYPTISCAKL